MTVDLTSTKWTANLALFALPKHEQEVLVQAKLVVDPTAFRILVNAAIGELLFDKVLDEGAQLQGFHLGDHLVVLVVDQGASGLALEGEQPWLGRRLRELVPEPVVAQLGAPTAEVERWVEPLELDHLTQVPACAYPVDDEEVQVLWRGAAARAVHRGAAFDRALLRDEDGDPAGANLLALQRLLEILEQGAPRVVRCPVAEVDLSRRRPTEATA